MNLEDVQITIRPRSHWEAIDLGCIMVRHWAGPMYASWFLVATPVFLLTWMLMPGSPEWAIFIVWWLKPVYERVPLAIVSSAIFGDFPTLTTAFKNVRQVIFPGMLGALTYRRFSTNRAFEAPVTVLEKLVSRERIQRFSVLQQGVGNQSFWLTVVGVHIESFLFLGFVVGAFMLIPEQTEIDWWGMLISNISGQQDWLSNILAFMAMGLVGPVYVASGFSLYLNRRVELEAWDIELGFKRILSRFAGGALVVCFLSLSIPLSGDSEGLSELSGPDSSRQVIEQVFEGTDFHNISTTKVPKFLEDYFNSEEEDPESVSPYGLAALFKGIAAVFEILLWLGVAALIIYLIMRFQIWEGIARQRRPTESRPEMLMGLKISEASLPANVAQTASASWEAGDVRGALSLLYRAALATLFTRFGVRFQTSDTEGECLTKTGQVDNDAIVEYFARLTLCWQLLAYAHKVPSEAEFNALIDHWPFFVERQS